MQSLGKMPIKFSLEAREHSEDMQIYPNCLESSYYGGQGPCSCSLKKAWVTYWKKNSLCLVNSQQTIKPTPQEKIGFAKMGLTVKVWIGPAAITENITPVTEATRWCGHIIKNSDKICMCANLSHLNKYVVRERYQPLTTAQAVANMAASEAKIFYCPWCFERVPLVSLGPRKLPLTTFTMPFGRLKYLRAPNGISSNSTTLQPVDDRGLYRTV